MWDGDNYKSPGQVTAPGQDTELPTFQSAEPTFLQLMQHNDNADVGKYLCLPSGGKENQKEGETCCRSEIRFKLIRAKY